MAGQGRKQFYSSRAGFTLIELLTVIAIIALIAGMVVGLAPAASRTMKMKRMQGELQQLVTAIENYHAKYKVYPPDNRQLVANQLPILYPERNSLYYELGGTVFNPNANPPRFSSLLTQDSLTIPQIQTVYNTKGFLNYAENAQEVKNFIPNWKSSAIGRLTNQGVIVNALIVPVRGTVSSTAPNYWRYVSSSPTNNPTSFDLWAEVVIGKETIIIGNWKE